MMGNGRGCRAEGCRGAKASRREARLRCPQGLIKRKLWGLSRGEAGSFARDELRLG